MTIILIAIPMFVLFLVIEAISYKYLPADDELGYDVRDTATSLSMGLGSRAWGLLWDVFALIGLTAMAALTPLHITMSSWWPWIVLLFAEDLCYYVFHRSSHRVRVLWASHVQHHSSERYNLQQSISLIYQFFLHTERIDRFPRPVELVMNTPSHHRVHHGRNRSYLDKNYAGILIIWDRMFATFEAEVERPDYGITKPLDTYNPFRVAFHEWYVLGHDVRHARNWGDRVKHLVLPPGWAPMSTAETAS